MYYIKIPLSHLVRPDELKVETERQQGLWDTRVESLLRDVQNNIIPSWAADYRDLATIKVEEDLRSNAVLE